MKQTKKKIDIHEEAMRNFNRVQSALYQERRQCLEDRRFYSIAGAQWEGSLEEQFENKPKLEVNKVHLSVIKIINEYRNNRVTVDFISKDGTEDDELADVCDGLYRADEQDSTATEAYDNAFEEAVGGGFGAYRFTTEYEDEEDDENEKQRIRIEPIYDADSSVFFDLDAKRQDKSDAKWCFVMHSMTHDAYEEEYDRSPSSIFKEIEYKEYDWYSPDFIYVAEYFRVEERKETIHVYRNLTGEEERYTDEDFEDDPELLRTLEAQGKTKVREKKVKRKAVRKYILDGNSIIGDAEDIAGKYIPIIPTYGKRWFVDSIERCMGHVRLVKDAQRIKNMLMSKLAEISSLSAVEKPMLLPEQIAGHEMMWADDNIKNYAYLLINPVTGADGQLMPAGPIAYTKPPTIPPALAALMQLVDVDMKELLGNNAETEKMMTHVSGKFKEMLDKRIDGQAFIYMSNFSKSVQHGGRVWLSMAKDVYVEKGRSMKTMDSMGQVGNVELGMMGIDGGLPTEKNDLTKASFDVAVSVGPTSASQRDSAVNTLTSMMQIVQDPQSQMVLQSLVLANMEGEGFSDVRDYFRKQLVQQGVYKPTPEEAQMLEAAAANAEPDPNEIALKAMAQEALANAQKAVAEAEKTKVEVVTEIADAEKKQAETQKIYSDIDVDQQNALSERREKSLLGRLFGRRDNNQM